MKIVKNIPSTSLMEKVKKRQVFIFSIIYIFHFQKDSMCVVLTGLREWFLCSFESAFHAIK